MSINVSLILPIYSSLVSLKSLLREINFLDKRYISQLELLIINDSSPYIKNKDIFDLISKLPKETNYKYKYLEENIGVGSVRNIGISMASSKKYIGFIDDDDIPNLQNILEVCSFYDLDIIISPFVSIKKFTKFSKVYSSNISFFYFFLKGYLKTIAWNKLYKLEYIKKVSAKFSKFRLFEDELFFLMILFSKKKKFFSIVKNSFVKRIKRKSSRSRSFTHKEFSTYFLIQYENIKFVSSQSFLIFLLWFIFFLPKSIISFFISYLRSFYFRRIISFFIK